MTFREVIRAMYSERDQARGSELISFMEHRQLTIIEKQELMIINERMMIAFSVPV